MRLGFVPSIVPSSSEETVYLVLDNIGAIGGVWREADVDQTDLESVISDLLSGQYNDPLRVVAFNAEDGTALDVSAAIAHELQRRADSAYEDLSHTIEDFVARHTGRECQLRLV
jgi:hypothetical protein